MPSQSNSVARSALWNHAGKLTDYIAWYCSSVLIARGLGVELNGILAGMMSGVSLVLAFSSLGLEVALNKAIPQLVGESIAQRARAIIRRTALARLFLYFLVAGIFILSFELMDGSSEGFYPTSLTPLVLYGLLRALTPLAAVVLISRWHADRAAIINGATRLLELLILIVLYNAGMTLQNVIVVLTLTVALQLAGYAVAARTYWIGPEMLVPMRPIWVFGSIFWANTVVDFFLGRQGGVLFLSLFSPSASSVGLYDVSYSVLQAGSMIVTVGFSGVTLAAFARYALGDRARMDAFYGSLVRITSLLMIPVLGFLIVVAPDITALVYSKQYAGATPVLQTMLGLRILARFFGGGENSDYLLALDKVGELVALGVVGMGISILLYLTLIPRFDVLGAAVAGGIGMMATNILGVLRVRRHGSATIQWRTWLMTSAMTVAAGLAVVVLPLQGTTVAGLALKGVVFAAVAAVLGVLLRPLKCTDADSLSVFSPKWNSILRRLS